ncbi:MAG: hypothetical protein ACFFAU_12545 [Candidatus Hodarchaeota archaeon]
MTRVALKIFFFSIFIHSFLFQSILPTTPIPEQTTVIECIMVETSGCSVCHNTYLTMVKPFYDKYRYNDSINFTLIDVFTAEGNNLFVQQKNRLNITPSDHASLPWVIFVWNDSQNYELLDETELEVIEETFLSIFDSLIEKTDTTTSNIISTSETDPVSSSDNNFSWIIPSIGIITAFGILTGGSGYLIYKYLWKSKPKV